MYCIIYVTFKIEFYMGLNTVQLCLIWPAVCLKANVLSAMEEESKQVELGHLHTNVLAPPGTLRVLDLES